MSATLLRLPERSPASDASLHDLRFRALLGSEAWDALPAEVQRRFSKRLSGTQVALYRGMVVEMKMSALGWALAQVCRLFGAPLPLNTASWRRRAGQRQRGIDAAAASAGQEFMRGRAHFPQVIHSAKRFCGPTGLEEYLGRGLGMALRVQALDDGIAFVSDHYFMAVAGRRIEAAAFPDSGRHDRDPSPGRRIELRLRARARPPVGGDPDQPADPVRRCRLRSTS